MDAVNRNIQALLSSIQKCEIYREYRRQSEILKKNPELMERVDRFRAQNYKLQNQADRGNLLEVVDRVAAESAELRRIPEVNSYLDAELALCRLMQQVCRSLTDGIEMDIPQI